MFLKYCSRSAIVILLLFLYGAAAAQSQSSAYDRISIASPTAASLGKVVDYPVNYHTGVPEVAIPLYTVTCGPLNLPIALSYHASGLRVIEPAGWAGAGFAVDAGGIITRTVRGAPDEHNTSTIASQNKGYFSDRGYPNYYYNGAVQDWTAFAQGRSDGEPDLFFFKVPGYSGKFYFKDDNQVVLMPKQDIKIVPVYSGTGSISALTLTVPDGKRYFFGAVGAAANADITNPFTSSGYNEGTAISAWYLNKIQSADSTAEINLTYTAEHYSYCTISTKPIYSSDPVSTPDASLIKNYVNGYRLNQIISRNDTVTFVPGAVRTDLSAFSIKDFTDYVNTEATALGSIKISNGNGLNKKYTFYTSYWLDTTTPLPSMLAATAITTDQKRLRLDSLKESTFTGDITNPSYVFSYYSEKVPRRLTFAQDHWGFYNGATGNTRMIPPITENGNLIMTGGANRDAAWPAMRGGALYKITYPTGGWLQYDFEPHRLHVSSSVPLYDDVLSISIGYDGSNPRHKEFDTVLANGDYRVTLNNTTLGSYADLYIINNATNEIACWLTTNTADKQSAVELVHLDYGSYNVQINKDCTNPTGVMTGVGANGGLEIYAGNAPSLDTIIGGLRVKRSSLHDHLKNTDNITDYSYDNNGQSTGFLFSVPVYIQLVRNDLIQSVGYWSPGTGFTATCSAPGCITCNNFSYYRSGNSLQPMSTSQGAHFGYSQVKVSKPSNGYSIYRYLTNHSPSYFFSSVAVTDVDRTVCAYSAPNYPAAPEEFDYIRGLLSDELDFAENGKLLKEVNYAHYFSAPMDSTPAFLATVVGSQTLGTFYWDYTVKEVSNPIVTTMYSQDSSSYVSSTVTTDFASPYHCQPTKISNINSKGDSLISKIKYGADLRAPGCDVLYTCPSLYRGDCNSCLATYSTAQINCSGQGSLCYSNAYLTYLQCLNTARANFSSCSYTAYGASGAYTTCLRTARTNAGTDLNPIYAMQATGRVPVIEYSTFNGNKLLTSTYNGYSANPFSYYDVHPTKISKIELTAPTTSFTPVAVSGTALTKDAKYIDKSSATYKTGNLATIVATDGPPVAYLWDYDGEYTTAIVNNAADTDVSYTSFEANSKGNWTYSGVPVTDPQPITGVLIYTFNGSNNITRTGLQSAKTYILSYWTKNASAYTISGTVGAAVKGSTVNGWTYFEHKITGVTSVSVGSTGSVDELRMYPDDAQMKTYTYSQGIGCTSACDENNQIQYYQYDGLGRIICVRNMDGYILNYYQYKMQSIVNQ